MRNLIFIGIAILCAGCASAPIPSYQVSGEYPALRGLDKKVKVSAQTSSFRDEGSIVCRGAAIVELPNKETFSTYISSALSKELAAANLFSDASDLTIAMKLTKVDFSSTLAATNWFIDGVYDIGGQTVSVSTVYNDKSSYFGTKACDNMAAYFQKAVSQHFKQLFSEPVLRQKLTATK